MKIENRKSKIGNPPDMRQVERVLIVKMSAIGDIIHALPVSAALKDTYPHLEVWWAVEHAFAPLVEGNPCLTGVMRLPKMSGRALRSPSAWKDWTQQLGQVRQKHFDLTLDLQGLTKSAAVAAWSGARHRLGYHWLRELAPLVETPVPQRAGSVHIVDQYLDVARWVGAAPQPVRFPFAVPPEDTAYVAQMLDEAGVNINEPYLAVNPASAQRIKEWGSEKYARLMDQVREQLGLPCVLVTADANVAAQVGEHARLPFVNLARRTSLKQLAAVLQSCAAHVCGDTGSGHLAAAFARPVVSIVGPTDPERTCPYGQRDLCLSHRDRCGSGCDSRRCEFALPHCLEAVSVEEVTAALRRAVCVAV